MKTKRISKWARFAATAVVIVCAPAASLAERIALVIGNSAYDHAAPLANPRNDAEAIAAKLRTLGFETLEGYDLGVREMGEKIRDFSRISRGAELSLVFYAGHGMAVNGENYLVPIDARMDDESALRWELIPMSAITEQFNNDEGAHLLLLDACRDNPLAGKYALSTGDATRSSSSGGLALVDVPNAGTGTGIAYATSPGAVARDGDGQHSPFTEALLSHLGTANTPISSIMNRVKGDVQAATDKAQIPWFSSSFTDDVFLQVAAVQPEAAPVTTDAPNYTQDSGAVVLQSIEQEKAFWDFALQNNDAPSYQLYLDQYPNGRFAPMARLSLERLKQQEQQPERGTTTTASQDTGVVLPGQRSGGGYGHTPQGPLTLTPTDYMRSVPANQQTEALLQIGDRNFRENNKVLQARLTAAGYNVGTLDGLIGNGTRGQIRQWQAANGLPQSGYFNAVQLQLLYAQSEATYAQVLAAAPQQTTRRSSSSGQSTRRPSSNSQQLPDVIREPLNNFFNGLGQGIGSR